MNEFEIYLKGGQVITIETAHTLQDLIEFVYCEDEREVLLTFNHIIIVKAHISAIKDITKQKQFVRDLAAYVCNGERPYKPWEEEK